MGYANHSEDVWILQIMRYDGRGGERIAIQKIQKGIVIYYASGKQHLRRGKCMRL